MTRINNVAQWEQAHIANKTKRSYTRRKHDQLVIAFKLVSVRTCYDVGIE